MTNKECDVKKIHLKKRKYFKQKKNLDNSIQTPNYCGSKRGKNEEQKQ